MREKIDESRTTWLKDKVRSAAGDPKTLWCTAKQVLHTTKSDMLNEDDCSSLCVKHCFFFSDKVNRVHSAAAAVVNNCSVPADKQHNGEEINSFDDVSVFEVLKLIAQLPNKSSPRDTLPTPLLKQCAAVFAPIIAHLTWQISHSKTVCFLQSSKQHRCYHY